MTGSNARQAARRRAPADSDADLLGRVAAADAGALEALYDRYSGLAYAVALRVTADEKLAIDAAADAFSAVWRNAARYDPEGATVKIWLLSIVHRRAIEAVHRRTATERQAADAAGAGPVEPGPPVHPDIWGEAAGRLDGAMVRQALRSLSEEQRTVIELAYFGGLTQEEIAARTGDSLGTVKARFRRGLLALRRELLGGEDAEVLASQAGTGRSWA